MKITIMTAWNTDDSASIHSRALVDEWLDMGHKVTVFSFVQDDYEPYQLANKDERHVIRCFSKKGVMDPRPILTIDFDIFVVENLRMLPVDELAKIYPLIKSRSRTVHIVHEDKLPNKGWFYQFIWDKVVYYDARQDFLKEVYPDAEFIPFPCVLVKKSDKFSSREELNLPLDKKIIFVFCQKGYEPYLHELNEPLKGEAVLLFVVPIKYEWREGKVPSSESIIREEGALSRDKLEKYLSASDAAVFHKLHSRYHNVVSSMIFQAIGTDCPIFVPEQSEFFNPLKDEVFYYSDVEELYTKLIRVLENHNEMSKVREASEVFVRLNSANKIAQRYIDLFTTILREAR